MNKIAHRTYFALLLAIALIVGLVTFTVRYALHAEQWVGFTGSPHLYTDGQLDADLTLLDRSGEMVYSSDDGGTYADGPLGRSSMLHLLGDREGWIASTLLNEYRGALVGYNRLSGTYGMDASEGVGRLTVSLEAQRTALDYLDGRAGAVGVYNYRTGEILCAVSSPTYDPDNVPNDVENDPAYDGVYVNRLLHGSYTPGSIFKLVTATAAIEQMPGWDSRMWTCEGELDIGNDTVICNGVHGDLTLPQALAHSCNVAFAQIAIELGPETLSKYAEQLGITSSDSLSFDGFSVYDGNYDVSDADAFEFAWSGIGQYNDQINPLQFMTLMGAIGARGQAAQPYLMGEITNDGHTQYQPSTQLLEPSIKGQTAELLAGMMRDNVTTMYGAITLDLPVCAKSGTAETGGGSADATFAGFIDDADYPLAFIVIVEDGGSGSQTAAPIANAVLAACVETLDEE